MELEDFLRQTQAEVRAREGSLYAELTFAEVVMQHMSEIGMTFEPEVCHYSAKVGNANLRLSGFAISDETDQLDLFVSLYSGADILQWITKEETFEAAKQCMQFLKKCVEGRLASTMEESHDAYSLAVTIKGSYANLDQIRIYVLTDRQAKAKNFKPQEFKGKTIKLEVIDIERLHRHWSEGKPRDELVVNFEEISGSALPCVFVPGSMTDYDYAMTAIPGEALRFIYEKYGARLLEANVRSFLSVTGKVNKGIRDTIRNNPEHFMAYNNGIVIVADDILIEKTSDGGPGILWLKGMQIVNGGQTTASIYFTKRKNPDVDLGHVRVPAKVIILRSDDAATEEALISDISRYANSQNSVRQSDLSANKSFHTELEKLSLNTYCLDGVGRWFYERAAGSYKTLLDREGTTPAPLRQIRETIPSSRKITKTDLAKYLNAWDGKPDFVSLGAQKNFERFMNSLKVEDGQPALPLPNVATWKAMIAKAILFKKTQNLVRPMFPAFQGNVVVYLISLFADRFGDRIKLEIIWESQDISPVLCQLLQTWAKEVNDVLHRTANGKMISEWAKKPECWEKVRWASYSQPIGNIPEIR
ncbi:MAG: AIPR family protein [Methylococcales bacterium]